MIEYKEAIGRRKTASARVRLYPGTGDIVVNDKPVNDYFGRDLDQMILRQPLLLTGTESAYNISVHVAGGGESGQAASVSRIWRRRRTNRSRWRRRFWWRRFIRFTWDGSTRGCARWAWPRWS